MLRFKFAFFRNKAGVWGWRSDKTEVINGYECKVFSATNVELVTKTRTEHLTETDKARSKNNKHPLQNFLGIAEVGESQATALIPNVNNFSPKNYNSIFRAVTSEIWIVVIYSTELTKDCCHCLSIHLFIIQLKFEYHSCNPSKYFLIVPKIYGV